MARICEKLFAMSMETVPLPQHLAARYLDEQGLDIADA